MTKVQKLSLDIECVIADLSPKVVSFFQTNCQFASYTTRFWRTVLPFPFPISSHFPRFQGLLPLSPILLLLSFCLHLPVIFCASCIVSTTTFSSSNFSLFECFSPPTIFISEKNSNDAIENRKNRRICRKRRKKLFRLRVKPRDRNNSQEESRKKIFENYLRKTK